MSRTANLKRQHDAALDLVGQITAQTAKIACPEDAYRVALLLAKLTGLLRIHFAQEDRTLYPLMMASTDEDAAAAARAFFNEMGDLGALYDAFATRWSRSEAILQDLERFRSESSHIFAALGNRIQRENEVLYPLADAMNVRHVA